MESCIFCAIIEKKIPSSVIAENNNVIVIKDRNPRASLHYLIIPKIHIKNIQSLDASDYGASLFAMAQELAQKEKVDHFRFVVNNGEKAGQSVFHLHAHFLSGNLSEGL